MAILKGWRYAAFLGGLIGAITLTLYPIVIHPLINTEKYKKLQEHNRRGIRQEDVQPGNMKIWSDPFDRRNTSSKSKE